MDILTLLPVHDKTATKQYDMHIMRTSHSAQPPPPVQRCSEFFSQSTRVEPSKRPEKVSLLSGYKTGVPAPRTWLPIAPCKIRYMPLTVPYRIPVTPTPSSFEIMRMSTSKQQNKLCNIQAPKLQQFSDEFKSRLT
jgi:hypothetical protein